MDRTVVVVPCFNEEQRLDLDAFRQALARSEALKLLFVDDGSLDGTRARLGDFATEWDPDRCEVLVLERNRGKAEAVRRGVLQAMTTDTFAVGYWDADLATPLDEVAAFEGFLRGQPDTVAVLGSRIRLMGRLVRRKASRHYTGRIFATLASLALGFPVYDTQCGAKLFRALPALREVFATPFMSRWVFDVEILGRLARIYGKDLGDRRIVVEYPLLRWSDTSGSKIRLTDLPGMAADLWRIRRAFHQR